MQPNFRSWLGPPDPVSSPIAVTKFYWRAESEMNAVRGHGSPRNEDLYKQATSMNIQRDPRPMGAQLTTVYVLGSR